MAVKLTKQKKVLPQKSVVRLLALSIFMFTLSACTGKTAEEHIQQAQTFVQQGDTNAAVVELKSAVQLEPRSPAARFELGKVYISQNDFESAEKELSRALELGHPAAEVVPLLSEAYQRTGANVALADLEIDEQSLTNSEKLEVGFRQLQSLLQLDKTSEARELIDKMRDIDSTSVYKDLIIAHNDVLEQEYANALEKAEALVERAPLNRDILNFTARLYMLNGEQEKAAEIYESYVEVASEDLEAKFSLANMLVQQGDTERAEQYVDELMAVNENNPFLNQLKGIIRASSNDYENALLFSEKAIQFGQSDPRARLVAGFAAHELGAFEKAVGHLSLIASALPDGHPALRILAASQLQSDMGNEANEILPRLGDISTEDASLFSRAGYELLKEGNENAAREVIEQAERISETPEDLTRLGILKLSLNDVEGILNLEDAVEQAPDSFTAKATLGTAYLSTNQYDKAIELAKEWQRTAPTDVQGYILEAEVLQRQENFSGAEALFEKIKTFAPNSDMLLGAQIRSNLRQKNLDSALTFTEQLLKQDSANSLGLASFFAIKTSQNEREQGIERIQQAFTQHPDNQNIALLLARAALSDEKYDLALESLEGISADRSAPNQFWTMRGLALIRTNQSDAAEKHYELWSEVFPNQEAAVLGRLLIADAKRDFSRAVDISTDFLRREDNLEVTFMQAYFYIMAGELENAKSALDAIDDKYRPLPFLRGVEARIAMFEGRPADALDDALIAYESNKNIDNLLVLVRALDGSGQRDKSFDTIQAHYDANPDDLRAKLLLAERQIDRDSSEAIANYRAALERSPNNFVVLNNLAYLLMESGDLKSAEEFSERAYEMQADNAAIVDTYAQILVKQGETEKALEAYNKVMTDEVNNEEIILNYIETLLINDSKVIARRRLDSQTFTAQESLDRVESLVKEYNL